jgi:stearoyl-CoA desaturase (delta-9 desaturase)
MDFHPLVSHFFRFWLWLTTSMVTKEWVAVHRYHHSEVETEEDPHSPQVLGLKKVLFEGAELYREASRNLNTLERFGKGTPDDWVETHIYSHAKWRNAGIVLMFIADAVLFGIPGIAIWAIQMMWIPFFAAGVINGVGHFWGYRNFESPDASRNIFPIGLIMGGEELHNNHHTFATSAKLSARWWEFDIGWLYIRVFQFFRLIKLNRSLPRLRLDKQKSYLDTDSLKAILNHRFQVLDHYWRKVIRPVLRREQKKLCKPHRVLLRNYAKMLVKENGAMTINEQEALQLVIKAHGPLHTVYQFALSLQEFWQRNTENHAELLEKLQKWSQQAELTGIKSSQKFAHRLCSYSV